MQSPPAPAPSLNVEGWRAFAIARTTLPARVRVSHAEENRASDAHVG